jgi:hypothetical protein
MKVWRAMATAAAVALVVLSLAACGAKPTRCEVIDVSFSTTFVRTDYMERFAADLTATADAGGRVVAVVVSGNPLVESNPKSQSFAGFEGTERSGERSGMVAAFTEIVQADIEQAGSGVRNPTKGSGILAGIALMGSGNCDSITVLSDGLERSDIVVDKDDILTEPGRARLIDQLDARGRVPNLQGAELRFPFGGYVPQGSTLTRERVGALPKFWKAYADRAHASFSWRN